MSSEQGSTGQGGPATAETGSVPEATGTYQREERISTGPHADVWRARGLRGPVALKVATTPHGRSMLLREAELLDGLSHPTVVSLEARDPKGRFIATELVDGGPADAWARPDHGPARTDAEIAELLARVADGLDYLHAHRVIHGDLKPGNILVDREGRPRIIDLGISQLDDPDTADQQATGFHGTLGYAAPELLSGGAPSVATDIYALGAVAYKLVTGRLPFSADDRAALAWLPLKTLPTPPGALRPDIPQQLGELVLRMLARRIRSRPGDARLVAAALRSCASGSAGPPIVGMARERDALRRLVVAAASGESALAVVHGRVGSGRLTLIREAVEAARREGMQLLRYQAGATPAEAADSIAKEASRRPSVVTLDARDEEVPGVAARLFTRRVPGLVLVRAERPLPALINLGARHVAAPALREADIALLVQHQGLDPDDAPELLRLSGGRPGALRAVLSRRALPGDVSAPERQLLLETSEGPVSVVELATRLQLSEHDLLDVADPLLDRGLLAESADGVFLERTG